jgi:hypothetical protein
VGVPAATGKRRISMSFVRRMTVARASLPALAVLTLTAAAHAGVVDSPLPVISGSDPTKHVFTVPDVLNSPVLLATVFQCTSLDTVPLNIAVEVFANAGGGPLNSATSGTLIVGVGQTVTFATQRTSRKLACTAYGMHSAPLASATCTSFRC